MQSERSDSSGSIAASAFSSEERDVCAMLGFVPSVAVGVVGIGHVPGIIANWNQLQDIQQLLQ